MYFGATVSIAVPAPKRIARATARQDGQSPSEGSGALMQINALQNARVID
jgi:hypothetical protein